MSSGNSKPPLTVCDRVVGDSSMDAAVTAENCVPIEYPERNRYASEYEYLA